MDKNDSITDNRTRQRFACDLRLPCCGTVAGIQRINLGLFTADIDVTARDSDAAGQQRGRTREPAVFLAQIHRPDLFAIIRIERFYHARAIGCIDHVIYHYRMKVRIKFANSVTDRGAPDSGRGKLVFNLR
ncbi:Uncharacterised protein [Salmonella enterica subsp. enterica serovar Bovismorbificans]|uniref:Uncharacterized protein n=1 Tax=Salmonella enterica subsp. enterica serovar Bovismorbificans TaxID=58097 RepID=A0A655DI98_SALET|nr:Uncharacterised protein [Salmonella enterica subsp. enterica serovar Bovismorbificans]